MELSNKIYLYWVFVVYIVAALVILPGPVQTEDDPILKYYTEKAASDYAIRNPFAAGRSFSVTMKTYYKELNNKEIYVLKDSSVITSFYSLGQLDSTDVLIESEREFEEIPLDFPNIFKQNYIFNFYPNDSGSKALPVGFDSPTYNTELPVGLAIIDRELGYLNYLYLYFINPQKYKRHSTGYRFSEYSGYAIPDSIWSVKSKRNFLSPVEYRYETSLYDFKVYPIEK